MKWEEKFLLSPVELALSVSAKVEVAEFSAILVPGRKGRSQGLNFPYTVFPWPFSRLLKQKDSRSMRLLCQNTYTLMRSEDVILTGTMEDMFSWTW